MQITESAYLDQMFIKQKTANQTLIFSNYNLFNQNRFFASLVGRNKIKLFVNILLVISLKTT